MKLRNILKLSTRTFRTQPLRTLLTVLGISIGIGAILMFVSLGYGLQRTMLNQITTAESLLSLDVASPKKDVLPLNEQALKKIKQIPNVEQVSPVAFLPGQITFGNLTSDTVFYACRPSYFRLGGIMPEQGRLFTEQQTTDLVLSSALVKSFGLEEQQLLGKKVKIIIFFTQETKQGEEQTKIIKREQPYVVSGIVPDDVTSFAFLNLNGLKDLGIKTFTQAKVKVSKAKLMNKVRDRIISMGYLVSALSETIDQANKIFKIIQIVLGAFGLVALFVAAIGTVNTMTVTLLEKTNEIGVMKAIGGADKDIGRMFLVESMFIGFLGGIGGVVLGFISAEVSNLALNILAKSLGGQAMDIFYSPPWFIVFIIAFSTVVGLVSGIMPARTAVKMNPLEALRYK